MNALSVARFRITHRLFTILAVWAVSCSLAGNSIAALFADFDPVRHERYLANGSPNEDFILDEAAITGLGGTAALITPFHFITAAHDLPVSDPTFTGQFRGLNGTIHSFTTSDFVDLTTTYYDSDLMMEVTAKSDVRIYRLPMAIPESSMITPMAILDADVDLLKNRNIFVVGIDDQAGRNKVDGGTIVTLNSGRKPTEAIVYDHDTDINGGTNPVLLDEASLRPGDSGYQALIRSGDDLALIGAHFGIVVPEGESANNSSNYLSFSSLLTGYLDQIDTVVAADGYAINRVTITAVPEPSATIVLAGAGLVGWLWRRKRKVQPSC
ncbi:hypothetical protein Pla22_40580 [Rubripirellula amarantea]|uniref:Ice-binding protein C-terminal domain-containing protein n=1 Tax=Rubripirellula amarantea TaxID=2527999 RepID=A0A5C5WMF5_9BACT|nr:PEP-CTERM sorting domain-containing protein [Rubripirellula amarantea]TWT51281.1 hypothetical protein Pla22_40580 [Rubripirellula amarantea]